jgi:hypothetical protein
MILGIIGTGTAKLDCVQQIMGYAVLFFFRIEVNLPRAVDYSPYNRSLRPRE